MHIPGLPANEDARRRSLERMTLLSTPDEAMFDRVTRTAQRLFDAPIASFTLVDRDRQFFKSVVGLRERETPRDVSFCGHVVVQDQTMVVADALKDDRFADNPLVTGDLGIRFYAGRPIHNSEGHCIGTLCIIDRKPRSFSHSDRQALDDLATWLESLLLNRDLGEAQTALLNELDNSKREALIDPLLWIWNRRGFEEVMQREVMRARREGETVTLAAIDLDHFKAINDTFGHAAGDAVLRETVRRLRESLRSYDILARWGGDELVAVGVGLPETRGQAFGDQLCEAVASAGPLAVDAGLIGFTCTIGVAQAHPDAATPFTEALMRRADEALYAAKQQGRAQAAVWQAEASGEKSSIQR